jgi:hypothetical protein
MQPDCDARMTNVDTVIGLLRCLFLMEVGNLDKLGNAIREGILRIAGVQRTTRCTAVRLG